MTTLHTRGVTRRGFLTLGASAALAPLLVGRSPLRRLAPSGLPRKDFKQWSQALATIIQEEAGKRAERQKITGALGGMIGGGGTGGLLHATQGNYGTDANPISESFGLFVSVFHRTFANERIRKAPFRELRLLEKLSLVPSLLYMVAGSFLGILIGSMTATNPRLEDSNSIANEDVIALTNHLRKHWSAAFEDLTRIHKKLTVYEQLPPWKKAETERSLGEQFVILSGPYSPQAAATLNRSF